MIQGTESFYTRTLYRPLFPATAVWLAHALAAPATALAIGTAAVESTGFLRNSANRANSATTLFVGPNWSAEGSVFGARVDAQAVALVENRSAVTVYGRDAALMSSSRLSEAHQLSLGRRRLEWSVADTTWTGGLWNPRFLHDSLAPRASGLDGIFAVSKPREWLRFQFLASYLSLPEMGYATSADNGKLSTSNPWNVPPPESLVIQGKEVPIRYSIEYPSTAALVLKPSAALSVRAGKPTGLWGSLTYGFLPVHQPDLTVEASLHPRETALDAVIRPRILQHHVAQSEWGWVDEDWVGWCSIAREVPLAPSSVKGRFERSVGPAWILGFGNDLKLTPRFSINQSLLYIRESLPEQSTSNPLANVSLPLPSRFPFERALKVGVAWTNLERWSGEASLAHDLLNSSSLMSAGVVFKSGWLKNDVAPEGISLTAGLDGVFSQTGKGWIGNQKGNDRMRGGVSYAF